MAWKVEYSGIGLSRLDRSYAAPPRFPSFSAVIELTRIKYFAGPDALVAEGIFSPFPAALECWLTDPLGNRVDATPLNARPYVRKDRKRPGVWRARFNGPFNVVPQSLDEFQLHALAGYVHDTAFQAVPFRLLPTAPGRGPMRDKVATSITVDSKPNPVSGSFTVTGTYTPVGGVTGISVKLVDQNGTPYGNPVAAQIDVPSVGKWQATFPKVPDGCYTVVATITAPPQGPSASRSVVTQSSSS